MGFSLFFNSILLGVGLAMDAFSVSLANGLNEPGMKKRKMCAVAGTFSFFQALMPMIGWVCIHTVVQHFKAFERMIPYMALGLLTLIGVKMISDGIKGGADTERTGVGFGALLVQGIATSIDALSVGFTIAGYDLASALVAALIIAAVTFIICMAGIAVGRRAGVRLAGKAGVIGGAILIFIGIEIFITSFVK